MNLNNLKEKYLKFRFNLEERKELYKILAEYKASNINETDALRRICERAKENKDYKAAIYEDIINSSSSGDMSFFIQSFKKWIPDNEYMLLEQSYKSGRVEEGFKEAVFLSESIGKIKKTIFSSLTMPFIMLFMLIGLFFFIRTNLLETFLELLPLEQWNDEAKNVYDISNFVYEYWWVILGIIFGYVVVSLFSLSRVTGPIREKYLDKIPPFNLYKTFVISSFLITFSSLLKSNRPIMDSLNSIRARGNDYWKYYLNRMIQNVSEGKKESGESLDVGLFDKQMAGRIIDRASLSNFEDSIYDIGRRNIDESVERIGKMMKVVNTLLSFVILGTALYVLFAISQLGEALSSINSF